MDMEADTHIATARLLSWQLEPLCIVCTAIVFSVEYVEEVCRPACWISWTEQLNRLID